MATVQVGTISQEVVSTLSLDDKVINAPILLGDTNKAHMKRKHNTDYTQYKNYIPTILNAPDYVGVNPKDNSIEYVKEFCENGNFVKVAVRVSTNGQYYARSLYVLNPNRVNNFIQKNFLKPLDNT